ncbi:exopolyphosphatase / guanosine-5'-triphosphate,3'-diphosphate pyrophosphatase [Pedobacter westerhofensis]|uniref:Exopolyphosphatase / guanosine-5'-triphosphate,3'-diphosphate pyrophosphatase n=1 Tax=Pedobacter westerhofensis TaxID=425512 RepID=A0A521ANX9_9SPHI|nr:exopolyphosphatase [Pedobacter westerhofensis]SMO36516.1 exopolyphosphatase / guanosine-5'-triphosphate,3'-diphosphate pyrophosphatase [Pedobacter westerhofensis]
MLRYAAIDVGSNAVRLLIADITQSDNGFSFKKNTLVRVPLRLGDDAFLDHKISERKIEDLLKTMSAFKNLMDVYQVSKYLACATSSMREAGNGQEIIKLISERAGVDLEIIEGQREANIIYANHIEDSLDIRKNYLYIDVGGGSTELSVFVNKVPVASKSFDIGTIRILDNQDKEETWEEMKLWVKEQTKYHKNLAGIGTGGNINKLYRMANEKEGMPLTFLKLKSLFNQLNSHSLKERIQVFGLNPDRADVIIPAAEIFITLMKWTGIKQVYVPRVGMADGIINLLIEENLHKEEQKTQ